jgi:hypothetical protein
METYQHYLYLCSKDSLLEHPGNLPGDFTIELPNPLSLPGRWEVGLIEYRPRFDAKGSQFVYLMCDFCFASMVSGSWQPVLRRVNIGRKTWHNIDPSFYIQISRERLERIRLYLIDHNLQPISVDSGSLECTLHIRRKE